MDWINYFPDNGGHYFPEHVEHTVNAIISGRIEDLQRLRDMGQLSTLDTMISLFQGTEWRTRMPIIMFIIYNALKDRTVQRDRNIIHETLAVFLLKDLSQNELSDLLYREYEISGCPRPLVNDELFSSDMLCTIRTTPLSWLIYLTRKNRLIEPLDTEDGSQATGASSEKNCLAAFCKISREGINQPFIFHFRGQEGEEVEFIDLSGNSMLYTTFTFNKFSLVEQLVAHKAKFNEKDPYPFFNIFKRSTGRDRYHVVEYFQTMLKQRTVTQDEIIRIDPNADRIDAPFFLMVRTPCSSINDNKFIIKQLTLFGFNPLLAIKKWTIDESTRAGVVPPQCFTRLTPRGLAEHIIESLQTSDPRGMIWKMQNLSSNLLWVEELCTFLRGNTIAIYQALTAKGLSDEVQELILSNLPPRKYNGSIAQVKTAISNTRSKIRESNVDSNHE